MPAPIILRNLLPECRKAANPAEGQFLISTKESQRDGSRPIDVEDDPDYTPVGVLFSEDFNEQPDFTATMHSTETLQEASQGYTVPDNWTSVYQGTEWSPEKGYPNHKATVEILEANGGRNGSLKCFLGTRESIDSTGGSFQSDGQLIKAPIDPNNPEGTEELYVAFWIRFHEDWYHRIPANEGYPVYSPGAWASKIFRCASWTPGGNMVSGQQGDMGPMFLWDYKGDNFGMRNSLHFRGGPPKNLVSVDNYKNGPTEAFTESTPFNKDGIAGQEVGGADPQLEDLVNGGLLAEKTDYVKHEMLFGPAGHWTKVAFHVKMNSAPGVADGIFSQYINGHRTKHFPNVPWVEDNPEGVMVKWNHFSIGGNDHFLPYPDEDLFEDYYYIDDIVVRDSLPEVLI